MPTIEANGIELYYEEHGDADAPAIVFAHGGGGTHIAWFQQVPYFRKHYRCVIFDHRGFGRSTDPQGEGIPRYIDDLEALVDHLELDRFGLVAQSMGGRTGLGYAVRYPHRVAALVMCDTWGFFEWPELYEEMMQIRFADGPPSVERAYAPDFDQRKPEMALLYRQHFESVIRPNRTLTAAGQADPDSEGPPRVGLDGPSGITKDDVRGLSVPTLFLAGTEDVLVHASVIRQVQPMVPNSEYIEFDGCGHSVYWEKPEEFNAIVGRFLSQHLLAG